MAPSGKGYSPPIPRTLRSESRGTLSLSQSSQQQQAQPASQAPDTSLRSSRNLSPTFPNLIPRSTSRDIDPRPISGPASQRRSHQDTSRARSRIQPRSSSRAQTGSSRPPPQDTSLRRPRDLIPRPRPGASPHLVPRPGLTPMNRNLSLGPGQGQFQNQLQAQPPQRIDPQPRDQNQEIYANYPYPFPTAESPFSQFQMTTALGGQDIHRENHRNLVQAPTSVPAQDETENETSTRASKRPRLSYSHSHPTGIRDEESNEDENGDENRNENGNETSNEIAVGSGTQNATQNERYNPNDTSSESPLSTPPDSVSTSPPLPPRNFPRRGTFSHSQRFERSPISRPRTRGGHGNGNVTASRTGTTDPSSSSNPSNPYIEPPVLSSTLDFVNRPTVAQKKWMDAVRKEGRRSDRNENGGFSRGIEGQMVRLFGGWEEEGF